MLHLQWPKFLRTAATEYFFKVEMPVSMRRFLTFSPQSSVDSGGIQLFGF